MNPKIGMSSTTATQVSLLSVFICWFTILIKTRTPSTTLIAYSQLYCKEASVTHHTNSTNCKMMASAMIVSRPNNNLNSFFIAKSPRRRDGNSKRRFAESRFSPP